MIVFSLIFLIIDIVSKIIVKNNLYVGESHLVIPNFFRITYVRNTGAAWSIFSNNTILVIIVSLGIILGLCYYVYKNKIIDILSKIGYALVLGGAIGNLLDRLLYGYVIDFIDIKIFNYNYPIFNLADVFIVLGVIILIIGTWRNKDGDRSIRK